jgi:hypothetical protein
MEDTDATATAATNPLEGADVGTKVMHRLSNSEYDETIKDLLGTQLRFGADFVHEETEGFDNIAAALSMSPRQVEDYFAAARTLAEDVFTDPSLRERIVRCSLDAADLGCATTTITDFGTRAFRRPLSQDELDWLLATYQDAIALGETPDGAMQHVVHVVLSAPQFLYRIEFDPDPTDPTPHPITEWELASRLSYAIWSTMPDDELFALASDGELSSPDVLTAQVERMLASPAAEALATNFAGNWLGARRLDSHVASAAIYPEWSPELGASMRREMELYFLEFLRGEREYAEFLHADFNFVDARLAEYYGVQPPTGAAFERIENTTDQRSGFLGLPGFLTLTSRETRSSPIIRGKWILDALWCVALEVPTDLLVEPLDEEEVEAQNATVRQLIESHRADPACSGCHNMIDPIGLSLEHYDGIGRYRTEYEGGAAIDSSGELPNGAVVDSLESLSDAISSDAGYLPCAARKFATYALGRVETDEAFIDDIVTRWTAGDGTLKTMIEATVTSELFTMRRAATP